MRLTNLYSRLTLVIIVLFLVVSLVYLRLVNRNNLRYYQEAVQNLNRGLAMYIAGRAPLIQSGAVNRGALWNLTELLMVVNPNVEVYLVDTEGRIIFDALPENSIVRNHIDLLPVRAWLEQTRALPITGTDPRSSTGKKVFSAWPIEDDKQTAGYLYVVLEGKTYQTLQQRLKGSYTLQLGLAGLMAIGLLAALCAGIIFSVVTRPLLQLARNMENFQAKGQKNGQLMTDGNDEISYLNRAFGAMKARIREKISRLEETDRLRRELVSNISHDLKTPLASMQGYLETLALHGNNINENQHREYLGIAHKQCTRLTYLVQKLFELSRLDAGQNELQNERFSLAELCQDVVHKYSLWAKQRQIILWVKPAQDLCLVMADIALIERVIENLIVNALQYTPKGGSITLSLDKRPEMVQVSIMDTGNGIPKEELSRIFDRYYRGSSYRQNTSNSTGLGLAIVKHILNQHKCRIEVTSRLGVGTCFQFGLPR